MKSITTYISEALKLGKSRYNYFPKTEKEFYDLLEQLIEERGEEGDFNDIDTSKITFMIDLFKDHKDFNGNISKWNVSNVELFGGMFKNCEKFNCNISKWNVRKGENFCSMFENCKSFKQDLSEWEISQDVISKNNAFNMFKGCKMPAGFLPNAL